MKYLKEYRKMLEKAKELKYTAEESAGKESNEDELVETWNDLQELADAVRKLMYGSKFEDIIANDSDIRSAFEEAVKVVEYRMFDIDEELDPH